MKTLSIGMRLLVSSGALIFSFSALADHAMHAISAPANSLSLTEAIELSIQSQPILGALDDAASASRNSAIAEAQLPDPKMKLGIINLPATSQDAFHLNRDTMTMTSIGVEQEMIPQAKREAAAQYMNAQARQYETEQLVNRRSIQKDVAIAWLDTYAAQRKSALYQQMIETIKAERDVALHESSAGGRQLGDILKLDTQLAAIKDRLLMAIRDEKKARVLLARWLGNHAKRQLSDEFTPYTPKAPALALTRQNADLESNPRLVNAKQQEMVAVSDLDRAQLSKLSNWSWELGYGKRFAAPSDMITFQIAFDLQTDQAHRQDQRTAEKQLLLERARKLTEDRRLELTAELEAARTDWEIASEREMEHQKRLIPAADARLKLLEAAYHAGKPNLAEVWEAKREILEIQIEHLNIVNDLHRAAINIAFILNDEHFIDAQSPARSRP